jgi:hypothetical protein
MGILAAEMASILVRPIRAKSLGLIAVRNKEAGCLPKVAPLASYIAATCKL